MTRSIETNPLLPGVSPAIRTLLTLLDGQVPEGLRERLTEILPDVLGTATRGDESRRQLAIAQWAEHALAPLRAAELREEAGRLEALCQTADAQMMQLAVRAGIAAAHADAARTAAYMATDMAATAGKDPAAAATARQAVAVAHDTAYAAEGCTAGAAAGAANAFAARTEADAATLAANAHDATPPGNAASRDEIWSRIVDSAVALIRAISADGMGPTQDQMPRLG